MGEGLGDWRLGPERLGPGGLGPGGQGDWGGVAVEERGEPGGAEEGAGEVGARWTSGREAGSRLGRHSWQAVLFQKMHSLHLRSWPRWPWPRLHLIGYQAGYKYIHMIR